MPRNPSVSNYFDDVKVCNGFYHVFLSLNQTLRTSFFLPFPAKTTGVSPFLSRSFPILRCPHSNFIFNFIRNCEAKAWCDWWAGVGLAGRGSWWPDPDPPRSGTGWSPARTAGRAPTPPPRWAGCSRPPWPSGSHVQLVLIKLWYILGSFFYFQLSL